MEAGLHMLGPEEKLAIEGALYAAAGEEEPQELEEG